MKGEFIKTESKMLSCVIVINYVLISFVTVFNNAHAVESEQVLEWNISAEKSEYYAGEPVLLTLYIRNEGMQKETVFFRADGIEAFSIQVYDSNNNVVCVGEKIKRDGMGRRGSLPIPSKEIAEKLIVLNQWCSTLLPPGSYRIMCTVDYILFSENQKQPNTRLLKAGPTHQIKLELYVRIIEMDEMKFEKTLKTLAGFESQRETQTKAEWLMKRDVAREKITFTESEIAVPYQLHLLSVEQFTWRKRDAVNSLVKSSTLEAATGLMWLYEGKNAHQEDIKKDLIEAVYELRKSCEPNILTATEDFVAKYKCPNKKLK